MRDYNGPLDGMGWAASTMDALQTKLEIAADNVANASVDTFQRHLADVQMTDRGLVVHAKLDTARSGMRPTFRDLDLAISGPGAFQIAPINGTIRPDAGTIKETRYGRFFRDSEGHVIDGHGNALVAENGNFLRVRINAKPDAGGVFSDPAGYPEGKIALPKGSKVFSRHIEASNDNPITEMMTVMDVQRQFESTEKLMFAIDSDRQQTNNTGALR